MAKTKKLPSTKKLFSLHRALGSTLNYLALARKIGDDHAQVTSHIDAGLKDLRLAWRQLVGIGAGRGSTLSLRNSDETKRTQKQVDKVLSGIEDLVKSLKLQKKQSLRITKKQARDASRALIESLQVAIDKTSTLVPRLPVEDLLKPITGKGTEVTDISFDIYCPRAYKHHTRLTIWMPRIIAHGDHAMMALKKGRAMLKSCGVSGVDQYVIGLNSRVNQYRQQHLLMLDFDDITYEELPRKALAGEPGILLRTATGFHFLGLKLYDQRTWISKLKALRKVASDDHIDLSMQRGYATLRMTASPRKPFAPIVYERWD